MANSHEVESMPPPKLKRLSGKADAKGVEYEFKMAALVALRARRKGLRFQLHSNVEAAEPCDDLVLRVEGEQPVTYFIQLKHGKKGSRVTSKAFREGKDFGLSKYFNTFKKFRLKEKKTELTNNERILRDWMQEDVWFAIYTNKKAEQPTSSSDAPDKPDEPDFPFQDLLETGKQDNTFSFHEGKVWEFLGDEEYRQEFLSRLRVFGSQAHVNDLDDLMVQELDSMFTKPLPRAKEYVVSYVEKFKKWAESPEGRAIIQSSGELEEVLAEDLRRRARSAAGDGVLAFQEDHCTTLSETLAQFHSVLVKVPGVPCGHRVAKVQQLLDRVFPERWAYVDDRVVRELPPDALLAACGACDVVVVDVEQVHKEVQDFVRAVDKNSKLKLVVISADYRKEDNTFRRIVKFQKILEEDWRLEHLVEKAQESMMTKTLKFQGFEMTLKKLLPTWPELRGDVDGPLLSALARGVAALGEAPKEDGDTPHRLLRTLTHTSVLQREVLRLADDPSEHLVLCGFSREELEEEKRQAKNNEHKAWNVPKLKTNREELEEENSRAKGDDHEQWKVPELQTDRWTILSNEEEYTDNNIMREFENIYLKNRRRNVHLIQNVKGTILWLATRGNSDAISKYVIPRDESCQTPYKPKCVHENSAVESAVAWSDRVHLLLGQPGIGKSSFMCSLAARQHEKAPETWVVVVKLLEHAQLLDEMPDPEAMNESNVACVLAAAAGVAAPASSAARRCLEAALFHSDSVHIFVDGVDEVMSAYKKKTLKLLDLMKETRAARVWVASRPEVDNSLRQTLSCTLVSLLPLSSEEQLAYLIESWTFPDLGHAADAMERLANELVDTFALNSDTEEGNAVHEISDHSDRYSLLGVPLNLRMAAEAFADDARTALETKSTLLQNRVSQLDLFRRFVANNRKRFRERYGIKDPVVNLTNLSSAEEDVFIPLHQSCAMLIWTAASIPKCQNRFQESVKQYQKYLPAEKSGILWQCEDGILQFSHYMFVEYFVATWLFENREQSQRDEELLKVAVCGSGKVMFFLDLMLAERYPLHKAIIEDNKDILNAPLVRENEIDLGGRSALHLAAAYGRTDAVNKFLEAGYDVSQCDSLLRWTPLQYADATLELQAVEKLLNSNADSGQLLNTKLFARILVLNAVELDFVKVTRVLLEVPPVSTVPSSNEHNLTKVLFEGISKDALLCVAARANSICVAKLLIDKEVNVNSRDAMRLTPLHHAVIAGHKDMVNLLLLHGADEEINTGDIRQYRPLHVAAERGHNEMVKLLKEYGANVSLETKEGNMPIHFAALNGHVETTEILLSLGADIHCRGMQNFTALHCASFKGNAKVVKLLLSHGADVSMRDIVGVTAIQYAAFMGHTKVMKIFFEKLTPSILQTEINSTDERQHSLFHSAVEGGHKEMVRLLIENGANISPKTDQGDMPIHIAALKGHVETTEILLSLGADIHSRGQQNSTPLQCASLEGNANIVKMLLSRGADVSKRDINGRTAIHYAAFRGHTNVMKIFFEKLTPSILQIEINVTDEMQHSPLHSAVEGGHKEMVRLLIENGANISLKCNKEYAPIHMAALHGHEETTEVLLSLGADIHCRGAHNATPLHCASSKGHANVVKRLLSRGADVSRRDINGRTAIHHAALSGHMHVMRMFIEKLTPDILQREINSTNEKQFSPLHLAAVKGFKEMARLLIENGANISLKTDEGHTPMHIAALNGDEEMTEVLLSLGADIHCRRKDNFTPLHCASQNGHVNVVKLLLSHEADVSRRDINGRTAIHIAVIQGKKEVWKVLLCAGAKFEFTPILMAAIEGRLETAELSILLVLLLLLLLLYLFILFGIYVIQRF